MKKSVGPSLIAICILLCFPAFAETFRIAVASQNPIKIAAVKEAFQNRFPDDDIQIMTFKTSSMIPEQPIGYEVALKGVKNRLSSLPAYIQSSADYVISIENYIEESSEGQSWKDLGMLLFIDCTKPDEEKVVLTQATAIPIHYVNLAQEMSLSSQISKQGYPVTIGEAIKKSFPDRNINPQDWHQEPEFGGISRQELLKEAIYRALYADEIQFLKKQITLYADFPKKGIVFEDFCPLLCNAQAFQLCIDLLYERYKMEGIEKVIGLESRGFILGAALAYKLGVGFVPVRKPGKLPGSIFSISYEKEYGSDCLAIAQNALKQNERVLIVDDLIATGGTAKAAIDLVLLAGGNPVEFVSLLEVKGLKGRDKLGIPSFNLLD